MIEDFGRHKSTKVTHHEWVVEKSLGSAYFGDLEKIDRAYEVKELKQTVMIKLQISYKC